MNRQSFFESFSCAVSGIRSALKSELNFRIHTGAAVLAVFLAFLLDISANEWMWIILAIVLVMAAELMNTAIESLANRVSTDYHPLIRKSKDSSAGAVLLTALFALICGAFIFIPKILNLLF